LTQLVCGRPYVVDLVMSRGKKSYNFITTYDRSYNINVVRPALESNFYLAFRQLHRAKRVC
jgi:hypothetical protein